MSGTAGDGARPRLVLASASASRRTILERAGIAALIAPSDASEEVEPGLSTEQMVAILAKRKAEVVAESFASALVLGCDSLLDLDGVALGKPTSRAEARERWEQLRGAEAVLYTGHHLLDTATRRAASEVVATPVRFGHPDDEELAAYLETEEPLAAAGAFTLEGRSGPFVDGVIGDPSNVMGLSLPALRRLLAVFELRVSDLWVS